MINVIYNNGTTDIYLDQLVKSVTWSGDLTQPARRLQVEMSNTIDGRTRAFVIEKGKELRLVNDGKELFRGVIFSDRIDSHGQLSLNAFDENIYLLKNEDSKKFVSKKASDIVKSLCSEFGIPVGTIADTGFVLPKLILDGGRNLFEIITIALTETKKQNGRRFVISSKGGKLNLLEVKEQVSKWLLEENIIDASVSTSIEETATQVKVIGGDKDKKEITAIAKNDTLIKKFGVLQKLESADTDMTKSQIEQRARQLLNDLGTISDEATVNAIGIDECIAGTSVYIKQGLSGLVGGYYISSDIHTFEGGSHTMSLTVSASLDLPVMEYEAPPEDKAKSPKRKKGESDGATSLDAVLQQIDQLGGE